MQANEFVKKVGWSEAKRVPSGAPSDATSFRFCGDSCTLGLYGRTESISKNQVSLIDLKHLVESYELVQSYGSLEDAKKALSKKSMLRWIDPQTELLRKAITDVESCQPDLPESVIQSLGEVS